MRMLRNRRFSASPTDFLILKQIPTEETIVKNNFINSLSLNEKNIFFLNTYGSLYSINLKSKRVNWFLNLNQSLDVNPSNIFLGRLFIRDTSILVFDVILRLNQSIRRLPHCSSNQLK